MKRTGITRDGEVTVRWDRDVRGSADRYVMRAWAYAVTVAMTGGTCPLTGEAFAPGDGEVDRVDSSKGYAPGNVAMVSKRGNQGRSVLQSGNSDIPGIGRYAQDVMAASLTVSIPTGSEARAIVTAWGTYSDSAAVLNGPYGR